MHIYNINYNYNIGLLSPDCSHSTATPLPPLSLKAHPSRSDQIKVEWVGQEFWDLFPVQYKLVFHAEQGPNQVGALQLDYLVPHELQLQLYYTSKQSIYH